MDLEIGEKVKVIKTVEGFGIDIVGWEGLVDRRVSGGYVIKFNHAMLGSLEMCVGSIDWNEYVRKVVIKDTTPSPIPASLRKWHVETLKTIKRG